MQQLMDKFDDLDEQTVLRILVALAGGGRTVIYRIHDKYWTPDTDMERYMNPEHPDF